MSFYLETFKALGTLDNTKWLSKLFWFLKKCLSRQSLPLWISFNFWWKFYEICICNVLVFKEHYDVSTNRKYSLFQARITILQIGTNVHHICRIWTSKTIVPESFKPYRLYNERFGGYIVYVIFPVFTILTVHFLTSLQHVLICSFL